MTASQLKDLVELIIIVGTITYHIITRKNTKRLVALITALIPLLYKYMKGHPSPEPLPPHLAQQINEFEFDIPGDFHKQTFKG